tara:strand:+ start:24863 stop:25381 length:519 start_codon:yes stop_codon:yes gene_type:complete
MIFKDYPDFTPNLTPTQIFKRGAFGGTYWRPIYSSITKKHYKNVHKRKALHKLFNGISEEYLSSTVCNKQLNKYNVNASTSLRYWEKKKWIKVQDPYGWIQWYCMFYQGRRTSDDERQIDRWKRLAGPNGRFRKRLVNMIKKKKTSYNDYSISPKIRQTLLHWAYELKNSDL